jgi:hypothetical protein
MAQNAAARRSSGTGCRPAFGTRHAALDPALQRDVLAAAGCARVSTDVTSGPDYRPQLAVLLETLLAALLTLWRIRRGVTQRPSR